MKDPEKGNRPGTEPTKLIGGKYEVTSELGRGGMGVVLKARHAGLSKLVAIKVLNATMLVDQNSRARFELEAQAGARLSHPNLVSVFDYGFTDDGAPYLVMEYVEGVSLQQFLSEGNRKVDEVLGILIQVGKALRYLHDENIVHRDLKTSNILVQEIAEERYGRLLDLGIAKVFSENEGAARLTNTGTVFGSPAYMSPEQCQGQSIDGRADIYSFGCVLYECITGELPFTGDNPLQIMLQHITDQPKAVPYKDQRDHELAEVVAKCMAKNPSARFQTMRELLEVLSRIAALSPNEKPRVRADSLTRSYAQPTIVNGGLQLIAAVMCVVVVALLVYGQFSKPGIQPASVSSQSSPATSAAQSAEALSQRLAIEQAATDKARTERLAREAESSQRASAEKLGLEKAAEKAATERLALEQAVARLSAERAAAANGAPLQAAPDQTDMINAYRAKVQALGQACDRRYAATRESLRAFEQSTASMDNGTDALRRYNDNMAVQNGLRR